MRSNPVYALKEPTLLEVESKVATINIGCIGRVTITVHDDGWWEIMLEANKTDRKSNVYFRTRGTMLPPCQMYSHFAEETVELPEWMFTQFNDTIDSLKAEWTIQ